MSTPTKQAYILQLRAQVKKTSGEASAAEIYNASCAGCHGVDRKGTPVVPRIAWTDQADGEQQIAQ